MSDLKNKILSMISEDLEEIEHALKENLSPYLDLVSEVASHILFSGGKRLRPMLMILSARICGYKGEKDKTYSTIFEYLHAATLLHDDLVDGATLRRGKPVAHSLWGNPIAVLTGDFLLARSLSISAEIGLPKIIKIISKITEDMSQGEIHQLLRRENLDLPEDEYMEIIRRKTAVLMQGACWTGALIANALEKEEKALSDYGFNLGLAFQMADDLLDYTSDTS
ncbi:MAG: polyprenyl synthetase family protein, partial [Proteobacteria bacterium]|nr:polyprenyl synthetase family protein [Pseudomonadota bacterium]